MSKKKRVETDASPLTANPFGALLGLDAPESEQPAASAVEAPSPDEDPTLGKVLVRRQKKGQGGKTVTVVEGVPPKLMPSLLGRAKKALGCAASEGPATERGAVLVVRTGDHVRVAEWLRASGATEAKLGN